MPPKIRRDVPSPEPARAGRPLMPEAGAGQSPAVVLLTDPVRDRDPHVIEEDLGE